MAEEAGQKKQIMDVAKPGKTSPSSSSRPIVLSHKPILKDPMFNKPKTNSSQDDPDGASKSDDNSEKVSVSVTKSVGNRIEPEHKIDVPSSSQSKEPQPAVEPQEMQKPAADSDSIPTNDPQSPQPPESPNPQPPTSAESPLPGQEDKAKDPKKVSMEQAKQRENIDKLVHDKTYFMPITQPPRRHGLPWIILIIAIIIIVGIGLLMMVSPN